METNNFDAIGYFRDMAKKNKLAKKNGFIATVISNIDNIEGLMDEFRNADRFIAISDTSSGNLSSLDGTYGFSCNRAFTVFILSGYEFGDMESREKELDLCREIFHQFVSRIIHDKYEYNGLQTFFDTTSFPNQELGRHFLNGVTGLHFTVYMRTPKDLEYDGSQWED